MKFSNGSSPIDWEAELERAPNFNASNAKTQGSTKNERNDPFDILDVWTVLEALSPQSYDQPKQLIRERGRLLFIDGHEPWHEIDELPENQTAYYHVYLGAVDLSKATESLLNLYYDPRPDKPQRYGKAVLGVITLDAQGVPLEEQSLLLSSFGWSYGRALQKQLHAMRHWDFAESLLKTELRKILFHQNDDGILQPIGWREVLEAFDWLTAACELPPNHVTEPSFAIKVVQTIGKKAPDPELFNSFFLKDLQRARNLLSKGNAGSVLKQYLQIDGPPSQVDIRKDRSVTVDGLQPKLFPDGRWPGKGRHPLVLMQQLAVNLSKQELKDSGVFSVNGPPGTGKTTLLRDIIANVIVERAKALCRIKHPSNAFKKQGEVSMGRPVPIYALAPTLRGFEMVVACTNNGAAENLSLELPRLDQVDEAMPPRYFRTVSDALIEGDTKTWGLIAAALGNKENRKKFIERAWWDPENGLYAYLRAAEGASKLVSKRDPATGKTIEVAPRVEQNECPPDNWHDAQKRWKDAQKEFSIALQRAEMMNDRAQKAFKGMRELPALKLKLKKVRHLAALLSPEREQLAATLNDAQKTLVRIQNDRRALVAQSTLAVSTKPGAFSRLLATKSWQSWEQEKLFLQRELEYQNQRHHDAECLYRDAKRAFDATNEKLERARHEIQEIEQNIVATQTSYESTLPTVGKQLVSEAHFEQPRADQEKHAPTFTNDAHLLRDEVFRAAINLHKAFIDAAATQFRQSLGYLFSLQNGEVLPEKFAHLLPDLWATFFLVTPVVSTTFASFGNMFQDLPPESIGWLLVDEAGQAPPQAAVGAMMRSKRAVVVGDPLQLEPVTNLPTNLIDTMSRHFSVEPLQWVAPKSSVQGVSDNVTPYTTRIGDAKVGLPLLVHRRCAKPMFDMSNSLSYDDQMVFATSHGGQSYATETFGQSHWLHVSGADKDKWCPEEGEIATRMVLKIVEYEGPAASVFIVSPFKNVVRGLKQRLKQESFRFSAHHIDAISWIEDNVGTVHTFQGKEAETVLMVLGAQDPQKHGARNWATGSPNLLNVAVSRAKRNLYVIGNADHWAKSGRMVEISRRLTVIRT